MDAVPNIAFKIRMAYWCSGTMIGYALGLLMGYWWASSNLGNVRSKKCEKRILFVKGLKNLFAFLYF